MRWRRNSLRLPGWDYSRAGWYFLTFVTFEREHLFGEVEEVQMGCNDLGLVLSEFWYWLEVEYPGVYMDEFVVMPNHFHAVVEIAAPIRGIPVGGIHESPLQEYPSLESATDKFPQMGALSRRRMLIPKLVGRFKMQTAKRINQLRGTAGLPVWQEGYHDHIIRSEVVLNKIRRYIVENPARWHHDRFNPDRKKT